MGNIFVTGPPNGPVLFCWLASVVCNAAGGQAGRERGMGTLPLAGRVDSPALDTAWRASRVTSH